MLKRDDSGEYLCGISMCRRAPMVSHLLFADDCIVFCNVVTEEGLRVTKILENYERESGQKLNKGKTFLFFNKNTRVEIKEAVKDMFRA